MKRNNVLKYFMLFIFSFIISFFFVYVLMPTFCDEIWTYGFSYNISKGMIIYRDFNVLQTPLYFFIGACFIKIFGAYMLSLAIFNSILYAIMVVMLYKIKGSAKLILFSFIFIWYPSSYNLFLLFLSFPVKRFIPISTFSLKCKAAVSYPVIFNTPRHKLRIVTLFLYLL